jgi:DNA-binding GntR family transcriptional regulator
MKGNNGVDDTDTTIAGTITRVLGERIVAGTLKPGERLRQDTVAAEFGASHVPVREAFRRLEAQGLVVSLPRRGVRVAPLDAETIREVTAMRAALEVLAVRHAAPHVTQESLDAADRAIAETEASQDIAVWEAANRRFHRALAECSGMPRLLSAIDDLHAASSRFLFATWRERDWQARSDDEHRRILEAFQRGDGDEAAALLERHILSAGNALIEIVEAASQDSG